MIPADGRKAAGRFVRDKRALDPLLPRLVIVGVNVVTNMQNARAARAAVRHHMCE